MSHAASIRALVLAAGIFTCGLVFARPVQAASIPSWRFETEELIARVTDEIRLFIIISNDMTADEDFVMGGITPGLITGAPPGVRPLDDGYTIVRGELVFLFAHVISPGESSRFPWPVILLPLPTLSPGTYGPRVAIISTPTTLFSENLFTITVVPEPTSLALLAAGIAALLLRRGTPRTL